MVGFLIDPVSRDHLRFFESLCLVALTGLALAACAATESPAQNQTPSAQNQAQIDVQTSQLSVLVENKVGMPLVDVEVAILPVGGIMQYTKFAGRDGTPFNLRMVRPKTVRVTGKDLNNKPVQVDVPWK